MSTGTSPSPARPASEQTFLDKLAITISTACGIGFAPFSPGTFGSLPGLVVGAALHVGMQRAFTDGPRWLPHLCTALVLCLLVLAALWAISRTERVWSTHDDQRIVVDEVIGQAIAIGFVTPTFWSIVVGFALFRLLDITKPLAIGWIDREGPGAIGTLFDDVLAGVVAALTLWLVGITCGVF